MMWKESEFENLYSAPSKNGLTRPACVRGNGYKMIKTGLSPGTLGHLKRRDDRPSPVFQREICASGDGCMSLTPEGWGFL